MIVHSYYYGPEGNGFETSQGLKQLVSEDTIKELYTLDCSRNQSKTFDKVYHTKQGPVIGITRIQPVQAKDNRNYTENRTIFVKYNDVIKALTQLLDMPVEHPVKPLNVFDLKV